MLVLGIIPVILVEAPVLGWRLKVSARRALWLSFSANVVSTLLGVVLGLAFDLAIGATTGMSGGAGPAGFVVALVLMFGITLWIESGVLKRMQPPTPALFQATLLANTISYVLLAAFAVVFVPPDPTLNRSRMTEVMAVLGVAKLEATEDFNATGRFRASAREAPSRHTRRVRTEESGRIVAEIALPGTQELDGKLVVYEPEVKDGKLLAWRCHVPEAPLKHFPAMCRFRSAAEAARLP
jgi:hypothetical protein